jgi:hypothetical protein
LKTEKKTRKKGRKLRIGTSEEEMNKRKWEK